jgi:hypothetical protein
MIADRGDTSCCDETIPDGEPGPRQDEKYLGSSNAPVEGVSIIRRSHFSLAVVDRGGCIDHP